MRNPRFCDIAHACIAGIVFDFPSDDYAEDRIEEEGKVVGLTLSTAWHDLDRGTELKDADFPADEDAKGNPVVETFSDCLPLKDVKR